MSKPLSRIPYLLLLITWIGVCASSIYYINAEPSAMPITEAALTPTPIATAVPPSATIPDTGAAGWTLLEPGLERRLIRVYNDQNQHVESVYVWRLDQNYFRLDVAFDATPKSLENWQKETNAALVVNGGYFRIENERYFPNGLTVVDGEVSGRSYVGYGGMLAVQGSRAELRWLVEQPYQYGEQFQAALQSFPILVKPGGQLGFGAEREDHKRARRTVIAQDREGRILFIIAPLGHFTLHELSLYLTESDLNLDIAINLDGGGSTGILVTNPPEVIASKPLLPFVILAYPR